MLVLNDDDFCAAAFPVFSLQVGPSRWCLGLLHLLHRAARECRACAAVPRQASSETHTHLMVSPCCLLSHDLTAFGHGALNISACSASSENADIPSSHGVGGESLGARCVGIGSGLK